MKRRPPALGPFEWLRRDPFHFFVLVCLGLAGIGAGRIVADVTYIVLDYFFGS